MLPPGLDTPRQVKHHYENLYDELTASGQYVPFLYPWATMGLAVVMAYLLIDHRRSPTLQSLRFPLYGFLCAFSAWCIATNKARSPPAGYLAGLFPAWGALWMGIIMLFNDCQTDFQRIERADEQALSKFATAANGITSGPLANGALKLQHKHNLQAVERIATSGPTKRRGPLFWQPYPERPFIERLDWVVDVFCNFRGIGWSFQTYGIPALPYHLEAELAHGEDKPAKANEIRVSKTGIQRFSNRRSLLWYTFIRLVIGAIFLDICKTLMHHDAYFWGYTDAPPPNWLPDYIRTSCTLVQSYRLLVSLSALYVGLTEIFRLGPLFFAGALGPQWIGLRGEAWSNPPDFYGDFTFVLDKGLAGWWGAWWHQIFRFGFEMPSTRLLSALGIDKYSQAGKAMSTFVAFSLSGFLHACGSYTQLGDTRPLMGPFCFFALQPVAILAQSAAAQWLEKAGVMNRTPRMLRRFTNFILVHLWLYYTAPLLVDDFAKGGIWLYEPLPLSPLRLLGFGAHDDNGWDLWYGMVFWRQGNHWWDTGIGF